MSMDWTAETSFPPLEWPVPVVSSLMNVAPGIKIKTSNLEEKPALLSMKSRWLSSFQPHSTTQNMKLTLIKITLLFCLIASAPAAQAGWFNNSQKEHQEKLLLMEQRLEEQRQTTSQWEVIAGSLAVACVFLFVVGTALGAKTRHASKP